MGGAHGIAVRVSSVLQYGRYQASPDVTKIGREPVKGQNLQGCHHMVRQIFTQIYHKWVAMAAGAARLQAAQCRSLCYDKHHRWMVTVVMTLLIYSRVS